MKAAIGLLTLLLSGGATAERVKEIFEYEGDAAIARAVLMNARAFSCAKAKDLLVSEAQRQVRHRPSLGQFVVSVDQATAYRWVFGRSDHFEWSPSTPPGPPIRGLAEVIRIEGSTTFRCVERNGKIVEDVLSAPALGGYRPELGRFVRLKMSDVKNRLDLLDLFFDSDSPTSFAAMRSLANHWVALGFKGVAITTGGRWAFAFDPYFLPEDPFLGGPAAKGPTGGVVRQCMAGFFLLDCEVHDWAMPTPP